MRPSTLLPAFIGLIGAVPYEGSASFRIAAMKEPPVLDKRIVATSTSSGCKVTPASVCTSLPLGGGPTMAPDTVATFQAYDGFFQDAANAVTPPNYVRSFQNYDGSTSTSNYITYYNLPSYSPAACAARCDTVKGCVSFNLYFERDPSTSTDPKCCPNPKSTTTIKCALWGGMISSTTAPNKGQYRDSFQIVIAGSNGYNKIIANSVVSSTPTVNGNTKATTTASSIPTVSSTATVTGNANSVTTASSVSILAPTANSKAPTGTQPGSPMTASIVTSATPGCTTPVASPMITFNLNKTTIYGENIFVYGSIPQLGNWNIDDSYAMSSYYYTSANTNWFATLNLPAGLYFEYKYFKRNLDYSISWANPPNMQYTVPTGCQPAAILNDQWQ